MSRTERQFHLVLKDCLPEGTTLLSKVRLADYLAVRGSEKEFMRHFGRISQKHVDFLLVDEGSCLPLAAIELDDDTHDTHQRTIDSDQFKNRAHRAARVPLLRFEAGTTHDPEVLKKTLRKFARARR